MQKEIGYRLGKPEEKLMSAYSLEHVADNASKKERDEIVSELRGASGIFRALGYDMRARRVQ
jgi:hypothetical protein